MIGWFRAATPQGNAVAVKLLNGGSSVVTQALAANMAMLHQEARIMRQLHHPCVARVFGLVDEGEQQVVVCVIRGTCMRANAGYMVEIVGNLLTYCSCPMKQHKQIERHVLSLLRVYCLYAKPIKWSFGMDVVRSRCKA
jgi:hypothetical protein